MPALVKIQNWLTCVMLSIIKRTCESPVDAAFHNDSFFMMCLATGWKEAARFGATISRWHSLLRQYMIDLCDLGITAAVRGKDLARIREDSVERIVKKYGARIVVRLPIRCYSCSVRPFCFRRVHPCSDMCCVFSISPISHSHCDQILST